MEMMPYILIYPKELRNIVSVDKVLPFMHFVGEIDGENVNIIKNRFDTIEKIHISLLFDYLKKIKNDFEINA